MGDLGECGRVDGVVELAVTARVEPVPGLGPEDASIGAVPLWRA